MSAGNPDSDSHACAGDPDPSSTKTPPATAPPKILLGYSEIRCKDEVQTSQECVPFHCAVLSLLSHSYCAPVATL